MEGQKIYQPLLWHFLKPKTSRRQTVYNGIGLKVTGYVVHLFLEDDKPIYTIHLYLCIHCTAC